MEPKEEVSEKTAAVMRETMKGDLRDLVLDLFKHRKKSWQEMGEAEQREVASNTEMSIAHAIDKAVQIMAADGRQTILATLEQITIKDGIKAVAVLDKHSPYRHDLADAQGKEILIVVGGGDTYHGAASEVEITKDEPSLPLDDKPVADNTRIV